MNLFIYLLLLFFNCLIIFVWLLTAFIATALLFVVLFFFYLPYLSSIHKKAMYRYVLDGESALAWELPFPGLATCLPHKGGASR